MASIIRHLPRRIAPFLALCAFVLAGIPGSGRADDTSLFVARIPPNVMFLVDTSGSMNIVAWHPAFSLVYDPTNCPYTTDPASPFYRKCLQYPLCNIAYHESGFDPDNNDSTLDNYWRDSDLTFRTLAGRPSISKCSNTRNVYVDPLLQADGTVTRWHVEYLKWYFSDNVEVDDDGDGRSIYTEILDTNDGVTSQCLLNQNPAKPANYAKYLRSRVNAAREVLREVICQTSLVADLRYGLAKYYPTPTDDPVGGYVAVQIDNYTPAHATQIETQINDLIGESWTPMAETMFNVYRYFQSRASNMQAWGKNGPSTTRFPVYNLLTTGAVGTALTAPVQPVTHDCQKHYIVFISDGTPQKDDWDGMATSLATFQNNLIGDFNMPGDETELPPNMHFFPELDGSACGGSGSPTDTSCELGLYLDDIAKFMHERDFALDAAFPGMQTIDTYTVGFATTAVTNAFLQKVADAGGGEFYTSNNPEELAQNITDALNSIVAKSKSFTSAAVPASRTTSGDNFYSAFFLPVVDAPFWIGHLKNFDFTGAGEVLTSDGHCAIGVDPSATPPCASVGALRTSALAYWDAATAIPAPSARKLYLELAANAIFAQPTTFTVPSPASTAAGPLWFNFPALPGDSTVAPYSSLTPTITNANMATALINNLRGCEWNTSCTARVDANGAKIYLGDIYHSNPVVVGSPNAAINEGVYKTFANNYRQRPRVVYAGANDGFLHGFHAGAWDTSLVPPGYDRGTGEELMGFMPYGVRKVVRNLPKNQTGLRTAVYVDGSPIVADAWFYKNNPSGNTLTGLAPTATSKVVAQWRSVLIQGLRDGGQHYTALDITDPPASATTSTTTYPRYLWSFPAEDAITPHNGASFNEQTIVANTWSDPVITRVRVRVNAATDGFERWVAIFGAGYAVSGDPNGTAYAASNPKGRGIYMVDITTGQVLARKVFTASPANALSSTVSPMRDAYRELQYAIPSSPAVFDVDFDGFADVIYIGDLGGNLWKWVVSAPGDDPINGVSGFNDLAQPQWPFRLFFRGSAQTEPPAELAPTYGTWSASNHYQSFFFPPTGALRNGELVLAWGAGERADPIGTAAEWSDTLLTNNNHYYVVKDSDPFEQVGTMPNQFTDKLTEADLADFDATTPLTCAQMKATKQGYYLTGRDSEKFISNSTIFLGTVFTGSFLPSDPSLSNCEGKGTAYLYSFDLDCGVGEFPGNSGGPADKRRIAIGTGLPTRPRVSVGDLNQGDPSGCVNKVVVVTSDGEIWNDCPGSLPSSGVQVRSWRER